MQQIDLRVSLKDMQNNNNPLHDHARDDEANSSTFGSRSTSHTLPTHHMREYALRAEDACQLIEEELLLDGNARQNLATFCQTWDEAQVHRLMDLSINKNLIDKDEYPQTAELEMRCVRILASLWNAPDTEQSIGCATIGSSEACMLAGLAALRRWRARRKVEGKPHDTPNFVCGPVQICWHKFCRYWDVEMREVPMEKGFYSLTPEVLVDHVDENTILVMSTLGVTYTGEYEDVEGIAKALDDIAAAGGPDVDLHIDAASGGFLTPFLAPELLVDFRLPRVKSISASGHKFGLAPLGCGWVLWRSMQDLPEELIFNVNYLGGSIPTIAINFSRPAGQVIAQYYNFVRLGKVGYRQIHEACYRVAAWLSSQIAQLGKFDFITSGDPLRGIPALCFCIQKEGQEELEGFSLYELSDRLRMRGWQVPAYSMPEHVTSLVVMRLVIRQGFSMDMACLFLRDFANALDFLRRHPSPSRRIEEESGSFSHS